MKANSRLNARHAVIAGIILGLCLVTLHTQAADYKYECMETGETAKSLDVKDDSLCLGLPEGATESKEEIAAASKLAAPQEAAKQAQSQQPAPAVSLASSMLLPSDMYPEASADALIMTSGNSMLALETLSRARGSALVMALEEGQRLQDRLEEVDQILRLVRNIGGGNGNESAAGN